MRLHNQLYRFCDKTRPTRVSSSRRGKLRRNLSRRSHPMIIKCKKSRRFNVHFMGTSGGSYGVSGCARYMVAVKVLRQSLGLFVVIRSRGSCKSDLKQSIKLLHSNFYITMANRKESNVFYAMLPTEFTA